MSGIDESWSVSKTPILDSGILPPRARRRSVASTIAGLLGGFCFGLIIVVALGDQDGGRANNGLGLLIFFCALFFSTVIHELGHLLAGWALGFRFRSLSIGPFSLRREQGRLRIRHRQEVTALGCTAMDVENIRRLRRRMLIYGVAGSGANLLSLLVAIPFAYRWPFALPELMSSSFGNQFFAISTLLMAWSLIPLGHTGSNDGSRIVMLLIDRQRARRRISIRALGILQRKGVRPQNWKETWLKAAVSVQDESLDSFWGNWFVYVSASGRKDDDRSVSHLERCLELSPLLQTPLRDLLSQEAAVSVAWHRRDAALAAKWVAQVNKPKLIRRLLQIRIDVALCCARSDFEVALTAWSEGLTLIEKLRASQAKQNLREGWLEWRAEIQERQAELGMVPAQKQKPPALS